MRCFVFLAWIAFVFAGTGAAAAKDKFTGYYAGGNIGYSWGSADVGSTQVGRVSQDFPDPTLVFAKGTSPAMKLSPRGGVWGVQAGYTWRLSPEWLAGVETDFQWTRQSDTRNSGFAAPISPSFCDNGNTCSATNSTSATAELKWFGTARLRAGRQFDDFWLYGTAGLAYGKVAVSGTNTLALTDTFYVPPRTNIYATPFAMNKTAIGTAIGAGVEGILPANDWTWKFEYLYISLPTGGAAIIGTRPTVGVSFGRVTDHILRLGLSYRFAGGN